VQGRVGFAAGGRSIQDETQADCFAGAWTAWEVAGHGGHVTIRSTELDAILRGYLTLRDPIGSDPDNQQAHGSFFDRVSAFSDGYDKGVDFCRTGFGPDRVFTQAPFTQVRDYAEKGNSPYPDTISILDRTLPPFWSGVFTTSFGRTFQQPTVRAFQGRPPACLAAGNGQRELGFCAAEDTVWYDERDLTGPAYDRIGDWAVATAVSLPYAEAVRAQLGRSTADDAATRSEVCLTGWYTRALFDERFAAVATLSPGDVDEGVVFLLSYGVSDPVFPDSDATGFDLLRAYRDGFLQGGRACDVGF
jgi:predicted metalloprotease